MLLKSREFIFNFSSQLFIFYNLSVDIFDNSIN